MMVSENVNTALQRRALLAAAIAAAGLGVSSPRAAAEARLVDLRVVDRETGQEARVWRHGDRLFVAGRPGSRYSLRLTNNSPGRVLVVTSVDGVNVLTGQTAGYNQKGYVLRPYVSADISGWRKSDTEVAAFTYAPLSRSYAARTGRPNDVGVIGIAVFTERDRAPLAVAPAAPSDPRYERAEAGATSDARGSARPPPPVTTQSAPARRAAPTPERLGTGHGPREWSMATTVAFQRATALPQYFSRIEYDSYDNLVAQGVIPTRPQQPPRGPRPFPSEGGYVPDPPLYR